MPITFQVSSVERRPVHIAEKDFLSPIEGNQSMFHKSQKLNVRRASREKVRTTTNGFIDAIVRAYSQHHDLVLSPDQVWLWIVKVFSQHVEQNAETLRPLFVAHEGKMQIHLQDVGELATYPIEEMVSKFDAELQKYVLANVNEWLVPAFSTTTPLDQCVGRMMLMASLKAYFSYKYTLCCGLPSVTLAGTAQDWDLVYDKAQKLANYGMGEWLSRLNPVLMQFVQAAHGKPDTEWWNRVCTFEGGGSGPTYLTGWICAFMPFEADYKTPTIPEDASWRVDQEGNRLPPQKNEFGFLDTNNIPTGFVRVPIVINDNGREEPLEFQAGFFGVNTPTCGATPSETPTTISPALDWRLVEQESAIPQSKFWWDGKNTDLCDACFQDEVKKTRFKLLTFPHRRDGKTWDTLEEALWDFNCDGCHQRFSECK